MNIFLDMDGVLANFDKRAEEIAGPFWEEELKKLNWGKIGEFQWLYSTLEPMPDSDRMVRSIRAFFGTPIILTAIPRRAHFPEAVNHKREWIWKHFGHDLEVRFGPYAYDKQFHCKPGDILVDDTVINCEQWKSRGGEAILHTNPWTTLNKIHNIYLGKV